MSVESDSFRSVGVAWIGLLSSLAVAEYIQVWLGILVMLATLTYTSMRIWDWIQERGNRRKRNLGPHS